jgi:hypothetical protein
MSLLTATTTAVNPGATVHVNDVSKIVLGVRGQTGHDSVNQIPYLSRTTVFSST